jgi:hypothetical protein
MKRYLTINNYKKLENVLNDTDEYVTICLKDWKKINSG